MILIKDSVNAVFPDLKKRKKTIRITANDASLRSPGSEV